MSIYKLPTPQMSTESLQYFLYHVIYSKLIMKICRNYIILISLCFLWNSWFGDSLSKATRCCNNYTILLYNNFK